MKNLLKNNFHCNKPNVQKIETAVMSICIELRSGLIYDNLSLDNPKFSPLLLQLWELADEYEKLDHYV